MVLLVEDVRWSVSVRLMMLVVEVLERTIAAREQVMLRLRMRIGPRPVGGDGYGWRRW